MNREKIQEMISASLDGELDAAQTRELERLLAESPELQAEREAWKSYGAMLRSVEVPVAESPEAAWAGVQRTLRLEREQAVPAALPVFGWRLGWAAAIIGFVLLGFATVALRQLMVRPAAVAAAAQESVEVEFVETELPDASPMVYQDVETGWTVIWVAGMGDGQNPLPGT